MSAAAGGFVLAALERAVIAARLASRLVRVSMSPTLAGGDCVAVGQPAVVPVRLRPSTVSDVEPVSLI